MGNRDLKRAPHHQGDWKWWYEEPYGIHVFVSQLVDCVVRTESVRIPWCSIRAALARKDKKSPKRRRKEAGRG